VIGVVGAGAFGTALAVTLGRDGRAVTLWTRDPAHARTMAQTRTNAARLPDVALPDCVTPTADLAYLETAEAVLLALPTQVLAAFLTAEGNRLDGLPLVACCKGIDLVSLRGPTALIAQACPKSATAILTGPSFAADLARGMPTALTLAGARVEHLQHLLSTPALRLYRTTDVVGAELGGALKNVMAIAAGVVMGAGLGESARAALVTRGFAEMQRFATGLGARPETLSGLSGLGDLVLTCTSTQSRNLRFGLALGAGHSPEGAMTVEGIATARAIRALAQASQTDMPVATMVARLIDHEIPLDLAIRSLMSRPLKEE
jgi:glycerol-3-phosphate dehydrogenase (NAD(P)+)